MNKINTELNQIDNTTSIIHVLPCKIVHNGDANVQSYFKYTKINHLLHASLRGRPLNGIEIELPTNQIGLVLDTNENTYTYCKSFNKIYSWHLDNPKIKANEDQLTQSIRDYYEISSIKDRMAGSELILRVRTKKGVLRIQKNLTPTSTLGELKKVISELSGVQVECIKLLKGYPPKSIDHNNKGNNSSTLSSLELTNGDLLTLDEIETSCVSKICDSNCNNDSNNDNNNKQTKVNNEIGILMRKVVPANNSCLFTSVYFVVENGKYDLNIQKSMREHIAKTVQSDPFTFNEGILGKSNENYCKWIQDSSNWGGTIEIMILSKYYKIEICLVDIQTSRIDRYGEDCSYTSRVFILYDGIHFDPLYMNTTTSENNKCIQTRFSTQDDLYMQQALDVAIRERNQRKFFDLNKFALKCLVCQKGLKGQLEAQEHASSTGHINFGQV